MGRVSASALEEIDVSEATADGSAAGGSAERTEELSLDTVFGLLKNDRRRELLRYLRDHEGRVTLRDVAEHIAAKENGITEAQLSSKQRKRVYVSLYQVHLPSMDRAGVVEYNRARGWIERTELATQLDEYLGAELTSGSQWSHYFTVTAVGGLTYLFGTILLGPGSLFTTLTVAALVASLMVLAVADARDWIDAQAAPRPPDVVRNPALAIARVLFQGSSTDTDE